MRALFFVLVAWSVVAGIAGGLLRAGALSSTSADWIGQAAVAHAALMIGGFLGSVIGIERAVAVKLKSAFAAPLASALSGVCLVLGHPGPAAWLALAASAVFTAVNVVVLRRQRAAHTALLLVGALAWLVGNILFVTARPSTATLPWWFAFLVLTIAAERLEMTRLMRRRPGADASLAVVLSAVLLGAAASAMWPVGGGVVYGIALAMLAAWLAVFDIARRTVHAKGLSRYMAVCLLGGYAWLAVGGAAWAATALGWPMRDTALHALGLGFIVSMIMGHAPVILPAVARIKLHFGNVFYLPLAVLHASLVLRLGPGSIDASMRAAGAACNALAIALFALTVVGAAIAWRRHEGAQASRRM